MNHAADLYAHLRAGRDRTDWILQTDGACGFMGASQRGHVRATNQDRIGVLTAPGQLVAVLCDGMGGLPRGDWAADTALSEVLAGLAGEVTPVRLRSVIEHANTCVYQGQSGRRGGTTIVVLVLTEAQALLAWVGDSRAYFHSRGMTVTALTQDDTVRGALGALDGRPHPNASPGLLQAIGLEPTLDVHISKLPINVPGYFLLASDGAFDLPGDAFEVAVQQSPYAALEASLQAGGVDNASIIAVYQPGPWLRTLQHRVYL